MWYAFPIGVGVGVLLEGQSVKRSLTLALISSGLSYAISRGGIGSAWFALQAVGNITLSQAAGAYVGGAVVGTGVSYLLFGEKGAKDAIEFYSNPITAPVKLTRELSQVPSRLAAITQGNRAVANNAAGLPTGTNVAAKPTGQGMSPDPNHPFADWWGTDDPASYRPY